MMTTTTNGTDALFNGEDSFMDGLEKLAGILTGVAEKLDVLAGSYGTSGEEPDEPDAEMAEEEDEQEDAASVLIAAPLVNALNSISEILENATGEIMDMISEED